MMAFLRRYVRRRQLMPVVSALPARVVKSFAPIDTAHLAKQSGL